MTNEINEFEDGGDVPEKKILELKTPAQRKAAKELYTNIIQLAHHTKRELVAAIKQGEAPVDAFGQVRALEENIKLLEAYMIQEKL